MRSFFKDELSWTIYLVDDLKSRMHIDVKLCKVMAKSCSLGHWESNIEFFSKALDLSHKKIFERNITVTKEELQEVIDDLQKENDLAATTLTHTESESFQTDVIAYREALKYCIEEINKTIRRF